MTAIPRRIIHTLSTAGRARSVLVRRTLALILVGAAGISAWSAQRENPEVLVFAQDLPAGHVIQAQDLATSRMPADLIPDTAAATVPVGSVVLAAASAKEVITHSRILGPDITTLDLDLGTGTASSALNLVPLSLAKPDVIPLLHHGDEVAIISPAVEGNSSDTIATGAKVILTTLPGKQTGHSGTILVGLPPKQAQLVAAASLSRPLTVIVTGPRAKGLKAAS